MITNIDLSQSDEKCAVDLRQAFTDVGFAYISSHNVPSLLIEDLERYSRSFFALPLAEKEKIAMRHGGLAWRGYFPLGGEFTSGLPDQKEGIYFGAEHALDSPSVLKKWPMHGQNLWPVQSELAGYSRLVTDYMDQMQNLGDRLMRCIALGLGLDGHYFQRLFGDEPTTLFRVFNYPQLDQPETSWGVGEHTDMGLVTILLQDQSGGLEVQLRDGTWTHAPPIPGTFIINIGDMLQHWTHGIYKATLHRVRNKARQDRLSFPFFYDPSWQCKVAPIAIDTFDQTLLAAAKRDPYRQRWDGLDLSQLNKEMTYGEFVWNKIKHVFPELANSL